MLNSRDLKDLRADVRANVEILLRLCRSQEMAVLITQTKRDNEYQAYLYAQGRTRPGSIITNSKTTTFHGAGLAVDFCENIKGREYADASFFQNVAILAKAMGFSWGGDWKSFPDFPHLQWDDLGKYTTAMLRAGKVCPQMPRYEGPRKSGSNPSTAFGGPPPLSGEAFEEDDEVKRYNTIEEIKQGAGWATETVRKLMDRKIITGNGVGLDLSEDMLRMLVFNDRAGLYK